MTYNLKKRRYWMGHRRALNGPARSPEGVRRDSLRLVNDRKVNDSRIGTVPYKIRPSRILHSENYDRFVETTSTARAAFFTRFEIIRDPEMALLQLRPSVRLSVRLSGRCSYIDGDSRPRTGESLLFLESSIYFATSSFNSLDVHAWTWSISLSNASSSSERSACVIIVLVVG